MKDDKDKTAVRTGWSPSAGAAGPSINVLPIGTRLGEFEIIDLIGEGGFGIVYLAYDHSLDRRVAVKEYMPSGIASRSNTFGVTVNSPHYADTFIAGLRSFVNESRLLAQFDSPSLVKVYRFWEANGTAYMVMPYYEGTTLKQAFKQGRIVPNEEWIRSFLANLLDAVDTIHRVQCFHRDIAPDNILLLKNGRPLLLDFGAARRVIGDLTHGPTVILKPGYAPIEQYADIPGLRQGAWTDVYALAAVMYFLITGKAPTPSVARVVSDNMVPAREAGRGRYSEPFLVTVDRALAVKPEHRIQSVAELRYAFDIDDTTARTMPPPVRSGTSNQATVAAGRTAAHRTRVGQPTVSMERTRVAPPPAPPPPADTGWQHTMIAERWPAPESSSQSKSAWLVGGLILSAGIAAGVYWGLNSSWLRGPHDDMASASQSALPEPVEPNEPNEPNESVAQQESPRTSPPAAVPAPVQRPPAPPPERVATAPARPPETPRSSGTSEAAGSAAGGTAAVPVPAPAPARRSPEEELWELATNSGKAGAYETYLNAYPKGRNAATAKQRLERLQAKAAEPQEADSRPQTDDQIWKAASAANKAAAYEAYLNDYPNGRHAAEARNRLAGLKPPETVAMLPAPSAELSKKPEITPVPSPAAPVPAGPESTAMPSPAPPTSVAPAPTVPKAPVQEATPKPVVPESPAASGSAGAGTSGGKTFKFANQTMTGDFTADPLTGIISGKGRIAWNNGDQFEGTLVRGMKEGKGQFTWANGQRYVGDWSQDQPNGRGVIIFANGNRYQGDVKNGVPNGKGLLTFANGNRYEGEIHDGLPHGHGVNHFKGGDIYDGTWANGKSQGQGRYTWANGSFWEGEFRDDKRTENGRMVYAEAASRDTAGAPSSASGETKNSER